MTNVTIIGAGIGGLTTAIALKNKGIEVEIFEQTAAFKKAGSGIILAINAMRIYKRLGVYEEIIKQANYITSMNARTRGLGFLSSAKFIKFEEKYGVKTVAIHRATLHEILIKKLGRTPVILNKKLETLTQKDGSPTLHFKDGTTHKTDIVIGADGIHSIVRKSLFKHTELRDAKQICWRGISRIKIDGKHLEELNEIWGRGKRFGFVHISESEVYWFALVDKGKNNKEGFDLLSCFDDYHQTVKDIIVGTPPKDIICNEIWDLKPLSDWYKGNVCLLGDACHATTPNMGQGAVQAIESAMALSICLKEEENMASAFKRYQNMRYKKVNYIIQTSWRIGKLAQSNSFFVCLIRDTISKLLPSSILEKQSRRIFELNY